MKTRKRVLAVLLCAAMLLLGGCAGQTDDAPSPTVSREEGTSSAVSQTESALEASATVQPASPEVSQPEESSQAESSALEETTSSAPEAAAPETTAAPTTTTPQAAPSTQTTACQHSFHDEGFDSTCSELGQHIYICTKCGYIEYGENIPMKHDGKYLCEYCGLPLKDGTPQQNRNCLYEWVVANGKLDENHAYTYFIEHTGAAGTNFLLEALVSEWGTLQMYYHIDLNVGLNTTLRQGSNSVIFNYHNNYASGSFTVALDQFTPNTVIAVTGFHLNHDAPASYNESEFQREFTQAIAEQLNMANAHLLSQADFTLADIGFTSW